MLMDIFLERPGTFIWSIQYGPYHLNYMIYVAYHKVHKTSNDIAVSNMGTAYVVQEYSEFLEFSPF